MTERFCFQNSYHSTRERLLLTTTQIPDSLHREHIHFCHPLPGPDKNPLYLDWLQLAQSETDNKRMPISTREFTNMACFGQSQLRALLILDIKLI